MGRLNMGWVYQCPLYIRKGPPAKACGLRIDFCKPKLEELSINDASKLCPELLDFCIEGFCSSIG